LADACRIEEWKARLASLDERYKKVEEDSQEKDSTMQVLKEELKALQV
jgi:hypothetical protein